MRLPASTLLFTTSLLACADKAPDSAPADDSADSVDSVDSVAPVVLSGATALPEDALPHGALSVGVVEVQFSEGPLLGATLAAAALGEDGRYSLTLPAEAPESARLALSEAEPELIGAMYLLTVWEDADGDGAWSAGEPTAAFSVERLLIWLGGVAEGSALPLGWSWIDTGLSGQYAPNRCLLDTTEPIYWRMSEGYPSFYGLEDAPELLLRGLPVSLHLGGQASAVPDGVTGLVGLAYQYFDGGPRDSVYDVPLQDGAFTATLTEPVGEEHYVGSDPSWRVTYHLNLLYRDLDGDDAFTPGVDDLEGTTTCLDGERVYARYTKPVTDWRGYRLLECYGGVAGWRPVRIDPSSNAVVYLSSEGGASLVADPDECRINGG